MMNWLTFLILIGIVAGVFGLVILGMAVGVIFSNRRIKGSCGGLGTMRDSDGNSPCMACGSSPDECDEASREQYESEEAVEEEATR